MVSDAPDRCTAVPQLALYPFRTVKPSSLLDRVSPCVSARSLPAPSRSMMVCAAPPDARSQMSIPLKSSSRLAAPEYVPGAARMTFSSPAVKFSARAAPSDFSAVAAVPPSPVTSSPFTASTYTMRVYNKVL